MQSLSRIIKGNYTVEQGEKEVVTDFSSKCDESIEKKSSIAASDYITSYENIAKGIIDDARMKKDNILKETYGEVDKIRKEAYNEGFLRGSEEGYAEAFEKSIRDAKKDADLIREEADRVLKSAREEYKSYLEEKKTEIKELALTIAQNILKKEIERADAFDDLVEEALTQAQKAKFIIIKCNNTYFSSIKGKVDDLKNQLLFKCDISIIEDNNMGNGVVLLERDNGKTLIDYEFSMQKVKEILEGNE